MRVHAVIGGVLTGFVLALFPSLCAAQAFDTAMVRHDILSRLQRTDDDTSRIIVTIVFGATCEKCYLWSLPMYKAQKKDSNALLVCVYVCRRDRELREYASKDYIYDTYLPVRQELVYAWKLPRLTQHVVLNGKGATTLPYDPKLLGE